MRAGAWRDMLIAAVRNPDNTMLSCLVGHLVACERAGEMLHAHGCSAGQPMDVMVRQVLRLDEVIPMSLNASAYMHRQDRGKLPLAEACAAFPVAIPKKQP